MMRRPPPLPAFFMPIARRLRTIGLLLPVIAGLALLAGLAGFRISEAMGLAALRETGRHRLDLSAESLERQIDKYAYFPATLGLERDVLDLVTGRAPLAQPVNRYLEMLNERAGTLSIYVLNRQGRVVAASNWSRPDSFIGEDLSYRPYFIEAMAGRQGRFFGVGTTRGEAGYYLSSPLAENGAIVGVAVVKVSLEQLEQSWSTVEAPVIVSDENGVVILASVPSWTFTTLRTMDEQAHRHFDRTLQYNARPLSPLGLTPLNRIAPDAELVQLARPADGEAETAVFPVSGSFLAQTAPLQGTGWTMTVLSPASEITGMAWTRAALAAVGSAFLGILLLMRVQRRGHLRELERKVEERTRNLRAAQDELVHAGKLAVIGQLSAGLAHELNQPLAALRTLSGNTVKFLQRGNLDAARGNLERIAQLVDTMGALTGQLKSFARKSSGVPRPVAVRRPIDNALFLLEPRLRRSGVAVQLEVPEGVAALCDPNRLEQVVVNLAANGLDALAGRRDGKLTVTAWTEDGRTRIQVADNGPGLSEDVLPRLFEPFFTTKEAKDGSREGGGGLGLGLAISAGIVRDFGGTLTGANGADGGAVFTIALPAADLPSDPSAVQAGDLACPTLPPQP